MEYNLSPQNHICCTKQMVPNISLNVYLCRNSNCTTFYTIPPPKKPSPVSHFDKDDNTRFREIGHEFILSQLQYLH